MKIIQISPRGFGANTYVITADDKTAIVIDPSSPHVKEELSKRGLTPTHVLLTHCHFDHVYGVPVLQESGAKVLCFEDEKPLVGTQADLFELFGAPRVSYQIDETFSDNEEKIINGISVKALHTSGHTQGSVCYLFSRNDGGRYLFTGDTLFEGSIGRTDFPTGNLAQMRASLKRLCAIDENLPIYAGHGEETTLDRERATNPFLVDL